MIQANELRIGNWLFINGLNRYVFVSSIFRSHFRCEDKDGIQFEESIRINYQPIPLTEEILVKCGFEILTNSAWIQGCKLVLIDNEILYDTKASKVTHIKHLHQLQNLVHALTGQELNVEL